MLPPGFGEAVGKPTDTRTAAVWAFVPARGRRGGRLLGAGFRVRFLRNSASVRVMAEVTHETVYFIGHVQGVGFRYSTFQVAKEFEVTGSVKNLLDGRVQLEVEGAPAEIDAFVEAVQEKMHGFIRKTDRIRGRRSPQFTGFVIE
jgi:acylphosphatase